ncbi:MAG: LPS assembly protein LptD [Phycisphaerales bacterium]
MKPRGLKGEAAVATGHRRAAIAGCALPLSMLVTTSGIASIAQAQAPNPADLGAAPAQRGAAFSGRTFGGVRLATSPQAGEVRFSATRAWVWNEEGDDPGSGTPPGIFPGAGAPVGSQRLLLRGDVRVTLGISSFAAARAVVWLERIGPSTLNPGGSVFQVAVYFDRVSDPGSHSGLSPSGDRLMVTGLIDGDLALRADSLVRGRPAAGTGAGGADPLLAEGEARLARLLGDLSGLGVADAPALPQTAGVAPAPGRGPIVPGMAQPFEPDSPLGRAGDSTPGPAPDLGPAERTPPIFARSGIVTFAAGEPTLLPGEGEGENVVVITGGVVVQYSETRRDRQLQLTAERAVAFLDPGPLDELLRAPAERVRGIYLEGNVIATDGRFTLRGPEVYYDVRRNRAYMVDAVFWTYDARRGLPLYVRARSLMQTAANQVSGEGVTLANSSFFVPHLSIGASSITITREQASGHVSGEAGAAAEGARAARTVIDGTDLTLRAGALPFFYFPRFQGDVQRFPLRDVRFENSSDSGFAVKTSWNLFGLFGTDAPPGVRVDFLADYYALRGPGLGFEGEYDLGSHVGEFIGYLVPDDRGRDTLTPGTRRDRDGETRGMVLADHRWSIDEAWSVFLEGAFVSDENFIDALYEPLAETRREFASSIHARRLEENTSLSILAKGSFNDFIVNEYLLQSQGYTVQKLPEIEYTRIADPLFGGAVLWTQSYRFSNMSLQFEKKTPADLGFDTPLLSGAAFGLLPGDRFDDVLRASGLFQSSVLRFDTRHELSTSFDVGPIKINPFGAARFTAYDDSFEAFSPGQDDEYRAWFGGGVRVSTSIQRIDDSVNSRLFDLHRTRHIIEPSVTAFASGTNVESRDLPVYDETVEGIADGSVVKVGLMQTWQTQRGGEGRWRTVDFLKLNTEIVYSTQDVPIKSPIGRFFDYRPEFSVLGDFANIDAAWQLTDAVGLTVSEIYDLDRHQSARTTAGGIVQHSADFSTFAEVHYLNARDSTFVTLGADYRLTRKWTVGVAATYDVDERDFQELGARLNREFPAALVSLKLRFNNITDEVAFGLVVQPKFGDERLEQLRRLGRDQLDLGDVPEDAVDPQGRPTREPGAWP